MRDRFSGLFLFFVGLVSCDDDNFPNGLYDYQVERLLSGGDTASWILISETIDGVSNFPSVCQDSIRLLFMDTNTDSLDIARLTPQTNCTAFDTVNLGRANASGDLLFTDSLKFATGDFWILGSITSSMVEVFGTDRKFELHK